ncbi:MAG: hypothetical protein ACRECW_18005 [Phyllobacterium sp.]
MGERSSNIASKDVPSRLSSAVRAVKITSADRGDVVVDMRDADRARLELLAQDLQPVFDEVPADDRQWDFALSSGLQPRLWIDATSHVMMGRDRRTYRFVRDTRLGRVVLAESTEIRPVSDAVTTYIAERIVERQQLMEGDAVPLRAHPASVAVAPEPVQASGWPEFVAGLVWFFIGAIVGGALLVAISWERLALSF